MKMTTLTKVSEKKVNLVKPFVGSLREKSANRPILKTALITETHIIATDSHRLIRIKHNETVTTPYLHHFKKEISGDYEASSYPDTSRLMPDPSNAEKILKINVLDWLEGHDIMKVAAKEHKNEIIHLKGRNLEVNAVKTFINKKGKEVKLPGFNQISSSYTLDDDTTIEEVAYNCSYMLDSLKVFKKEKVKDVTLYFYGKHRPMYFVGGDIEALILPVRSY